MTRKYKDIILTTCNDPAYGPYEKIIEEEELKYPENERTLLYKRIPNLENKEIKKRYISLSEAIDIYEEYKINFMQESLAPYNISFNQEKARNKGELVIGNINSWANRFGSLVSLIIDHRIKLYGKMIKGPTVVKSPLEGLVEVDENIIISIGTGKSIIFNRYDYNESYNSSYNYDTIRCLNTQEIKYIEVSILYRDMVKLMKEMNNSPEEIK